MPSALAAGRDAAPAGFRQMAAVCSACIRADPGYPPFLDPGDSRAVLAWFRQKPLIACLVAEADGRIAGAAGLRGCGMRIPAPAPGTGRPADGGWKHAAWPCIPSTGAGMCRGT